LADFYASVNQKTFPLLSQELALEVGSRFLRTQMGVVGGHLFSSTDGLVFWLTFSTTPDLSARNLANKRPHSH
jgi:hypothetical protein